MKPVSAVRKAYLRPVPDTARILVYVYFDGPTPPIVGYWSMN